MRNPTLLLAAASLVLASAFAAVPAGAESMKVCAANWKALSAADKAKTTYKDFSSSCLKGGAAKTAAPAPAPVPAPAPAAAKAVPVPAAAAKPVKAAAGSGPNGATGQCKDGTFTSAKNHSGACAHHKGVAKWF